MKLDPFISVDGVAFTTSPVELLAAWGQPAHSGRNGVALNELDYGHVIFRFQDCGRLEEITRQAPVLHLGVVAVPFAALQQFIREQDPAVFERARFLVSPKFGLAFDPQEPAWVTALAEHCIDTWRAL